MDEQDSYQEQLTLQQSTQMLLNQQPSQMVAVQAVSPVNYNNEAACHSYMINVEMMQPCSENLQVHESVSQLQLPENEAEVQNQCVISLCACTGDNCFASATMNENVPNERHQWTMGSTKKLSNRVVPYSFPPRYSFQQREKGSGHQETSDDNRSHLPSSMQKENFMNSNSARFCTSCSNYSQDDSSIQNVTNQDIFNDCGSFDGKYLNKLDTYFNYQKTSVNRDGDPWPSNFFTLSTEHMIPEPVLSLALKSSMILKPFQVKHGSPCKSITFHMPRYILQDLLNRRDLDLEFKCYHIRDSSCSTNWPQSVSIALNTVPIPIPRERDRLHLSHKPIFLKKYSKPYLNSLQISVNSCCCNHQFVVQLVQRVTILLKNHLIPVKMCIDKIRAAMVNPSYFKLCLNVPSNIFELACPLGRKSIKIPARGRNCRHVQCFDLENFLAVSAKMELWKCPVCGKLLDIDSIEIDQYIWQILNQVTNLSLYAVSFDGKAKWTPIKEKDEGQTKQHGQGIIVFEQVDKQRSPALSSFLSQSSVMNDTLRQEISDADQSSSEATNSMLHSTLDHSALSQCMRQIFDPSMTSIENGFTYGDSSVSSSDSLVNQAFCSPQSSSLINNDVNICTSNTSISNESETSPLMPQNIPVTYQLNVVEEFSQQQYSFPDGLPTNGPPEIPADEQEQVNSAITHHVCISVTDNSTDAQEEICESSLDVISNANGDSTTRAEPVVDDDGDESAGIPMIDFVDRDGDDCDDSYSQVMLNADDFICSVQPHENVAPDADDAMTPSTMLAEFMDELLSFMM